MRLIDADATVQYLRECRCKDCDRRKGMKNGRIRFLYEIGDAPCRACDIGDTIDYFLDEDISPTVDAVPVVRCRDCKHYNSFMQQCRNGLDGIFTPDFFCAEAERGTENDSV